MDFSYRFPVVRGKQAYREYYIAMVPLKMLSKLFPEEETCVPPEYRAQRRLNESRVPVISKYITDNRDTYVFSALAASIDGEYEYIENNNCKDTGILEVSMDARFLINDGQHRKAAILDALNEDDSLGNETIPVVFFEDRGLSRSQQLFTDLNKHAVKTSNSISELYDSRDELAIINRCTISSIPFLDKYTDKERDNLGKFSSKLFTLNAFYTANQRIIGKKGIADGAEEFLKDFWMLVTENITLWRELDNNLISKVDLRENYIVTQGVVLQALSRIGAFFYENKGLDMRKCLEKLKNIDWRRTARTWKLRAIRSDGKILTNSKAIMLISIQIKKEIGLPLDDMELNEEEKFVSSLRV